MIGAFHFGVDLNGTDGVSIEQVVFIVWEKY